MSARPLRLGPGQALPHLSNATGFQQAGPVMTAMQNDPESIASELERLAITRALPLGCASWRLQLEARAAELTRRTAGRAPGISSPGA
jgi:hypothetical protein